MRAWQLFAGIIFAFILAGCGGGTSQAESGSRASMRVKIEWPESTRLIPDASRSVKLVVKHQGEQLAVKVVPRPAAGVVSTTVTLGNLPSVAASLEASAHPGEDGSGAAQASGSAGVSLASGKVVEASITMGSAIARIACSPASLTVKPGGSAVVTAGAFNAQGQLVLTASHNWSWTASGGAAGVQGNGSSATVTGVSAGEAVVTVREAESGKTATLPVSVGSSEIPEGYTLSAACTLGVSSRALDINNSGEIVGYFHEAGSLLQRPFVNRGS